jgi:RNA polymerase sigma-70 factor (ECF subfamily)
MHDKRQQQADEQQQHEQFMELIGLHRPLILHVCCTHTRYRKGMSDSKTTDDLYNEIVAELWKTWPTLREVENKAGWIHRVALNVAVGQYRKEKRQPLCESLDKYIEMLPAHEDESLIVELYRLIDRLDDAERELIFLYLDRVPQAEIGKRMGITEDAVNKRIRRIKDRLREMNEKERGT